MNWQQETEVLRCPDCRVWDPTNQPSVAAKLEQDPNAYADRWIVTIRSGTTIKFPGIPGTIPLWVDIILCREHEKLK
jgi:hypothetical protein